VVWLFDTLRLTVASRPLWIWLALMLAGFILRKRLHRPAATPQRFVRAASVVALLYYAGVLAWYAMVPQQADYAEPTMTCLAWLFRIGQPVYHRLTSAERYSHMYGPMAFVLPGLALGVFGQSMFVAKAVGILSGGAALVFTWLTVRSAAERRVAVVACGICALQFLFFRNLTFWSRPDPLQLAAVACGLFAAVRLSGAPAILVISASAGILWNLKITGPLYSLPIFALLYTRAGTRDVMVSAGGALVAAALPFAAFGNVSWSDYMLWVRLSAQNGLRVAAVKENIEWAVFLLVPVLARLCDRRPLSREMRFGVTALLLAMCGVVVAASKPGAGAYHLVPFLPTLAYVTAVFWQETGDARGSQPAWQGPFVAALLFVAVIQQQYFLAIAGDPSVAASYADVRGYLEQHPGEQVAVGYTSAERMTFARTLAVFQTGRYLIDAPAVQEHQLSGLEVPQATYDAIRSCVVETWLIPKEGRPFAVLNGYPTTGYRSLFPADFVAVFEEAYRVEDRTAYYDVWRCRNR
jgi:hypothetical protein